MNDALSALNRAQDDNTRAQIVSAMLNLPLKSPPQLMSLYDFATGLENKTTNANAQLYLKLTAAICSIIGHVNDSHFDDVLAGALTKEFESMPAHFMGEYGAQTGEQLVRFQMRERRLKTLSGAAGRIKDRKALPVLRRMLEDDGIARDAASSAIGQIGDPADLDDFIKRIKSNPKERIYIGVFGPAAFDRIMQEVNDPTVSPEVKARLQSSLRYLSTPDNKNKYLKLLDHPDNVVRKQAALAICKGAKPGDEDAIIKIAHDPWTSFEAIGAMGAIWTDKFLPTATDMLLHGETSAIRSETAKMLGKHKVVGAIPALQKALADKDPYVRKCAQAALNKLR